MRIGSIAALGARMEDAPRAIETLKSECSKLARVRMGVMERNMREEGEDIYDCD